MVDTLKKLIQPLKDSGSVLKKSKYDELKEAAQKGLFLEYCNQNDINQLTPSGHNLLDIAILQEDYWLVARLIAELEERNDGSLKRLLLKQGNNSPLISAATLINPQIFNLLLEQNIGFSIEILEAAKKERLKVLGHHRFWGRMILGAFLKSACPSKSFADTLNVSEAVAGFGFVVGAGLLSVFSLPLIAIGALVGLGCITFANMRKLWIERTIQNEDLDTRILLAQLNNYEKRIEAFENKIASDLTGDEKEILQKDLMFLKDKMLENKMKNITRFSIKNKKNLMGFLTGSDKFFTAVSTIGDVLCTSAGFLSIGAYFFAASAAVVGLPWVVLTLTALAVIGVSVFYLLENKTQRREFAEQRKEEFDLKISRYKSFKNFMNHQGYGFSRVLGLLKTGDAVQDQSLEDSFNPIVEKFKKTSSKDFEEEYNAFIALKPDEKIKKIHQIVIDGRREFFNHLVEKGVDLSLLAVSQTHGLKTLLHHAVEKGHSVMLEEMLGISITAQNRMLKEMWPETIKNRQQIAANYKLLSEQSKTWLVTRDASNLLPLHYAAKAKDSSLYLLLLRQPVPYSRADLDEAAMLRKKWIRDEKRWLFTSALIESICPGTSLPEIVYSLSFVVLVAASAALTWVVGVAAVFIYGMVVAGNYHKTKVERRITTDLEQLALDSARMDSVNLRLTTLLATASSPTMTAEEISKANAELDGLKSELEDLKTQYPKKSDPNSPAQNSNFKSKLLNFVKPVGRAIRTYGGTLGTFLCGYAGTLGIIELVVTATSVVMTGPVGWGLLGAGAFIGLIYAGFYYKNRKNELKIFAERTLKVAQDKEDLAAKATSPKIANVIEHISLNLDLKGTTTQQSAMQQLNLHAPHPGCDLRKLVILPEAQLAQAQQSQVTEVTQVTQAPDVTQVSQVQAPELEAKSTPISGQQLTFPNGVPIPVL